MGMVYSYFKGRFTLPFLYNHARRNRGRWRLGNINGILGPAGTGGQTRGHAIAFVGCGALDKAQALDKPLVAGTLVVPREAGEQRKGRALDELVALVAPLRDLGPGVRSKRQKHTVSQMPQLSKSRHQRSICAGVTRAGSSTNDVNMRASYQPVSQRAAASSWLRPRRFASTWMLAIDTPKALLAVMPNRARFSRSR